MQAAVRALALWASVVLACAPAPSGDRGPRAESSPTATPGRSDRVPDGPRYVVASGAFDEGDWARYQDEEWRYVAWGDRATSCARFEVGERAGREGVACTHWENDDPEGHFLGRTYDPGSGDVRSIVYGQLSESVAAVELRLTTGEVVTLDAIRPPHELDVPVRYYVGFVPFSDNGEMLALDRQGEVLEKVDLCHDSCGP